MPGMVRDVYWQAISDYGDDAAIWPGDDLFPALLKLYTGDEEQSAFLARLDYLRQEAERTARTTLATRALWAPGCRA